MAAYIVIMVALAGTGLVAGRWWLIAAVVGLWALGLVIAALAGAFDQTSQDTSGAQLFFAAWPTVFWVLAFIGGTTTRRILRRARLAHATPPTTPPDPATR